jgi:hypothetical protein
VTDPSQQIDLSTRMVAAAVDHWPLVAGLFVAIYWALPKVLPRVIKDVLLNGGGLIIRQIVKEENESQSTKTKEELDRRLREHEQQEATRFQAGSERMSALEADFDSITGSLKLPQRRRRRRAA